MRCIIKIGWVVLALIKGQKIENIMKYTYHEHYKKNET